MPIQNSKISVYKGAGNSLDFTIFDADGKPLTYDTTNRHLELQVFDNSNNKLVITKRLEKVEDSVVPMSGNNMPSVRGNNHVRSVYRCDVDNTDLTNLPAGSHYQWVVLISDSKYKSEYFYTSLDRKVEGEFHILATATPEIESSSVVVNFQKTTDYRLMDDTVVGSEVNAASMQWTKFTSDVMPGDVAMNIIDGLHTIALYLKDFTGVVQIQGTLQVQMPDAQADHQWFNIPDANETVSFEYVAANGIDAINFNGNYSWIRVVYYQMMKGDPTGTVRRVLLRR